MLELKILYYNNKSIPDVEYSTSDFLYHFYYKTKKKTCNEFI